MVPKLTPKEHDPCWRPRSERDKLWTLISMRYGHGSWIFTEGPHFKIPHDCSSHGLSNIGQTVLPTFSSQVWSGTWLMRVDNQTLVVLRTWKSKYPTHLWNACLPQPSKKSFLSLHTKQRLLCSCKSVIRHWLLPRANIWRPGNFTSAKSQKDESLLPSKLCAVPCLVTQLCAQPFPTPWTRAR